MSRRNPPARWTLPGTVNPPGRKLITLCIPDEPYHVAAFRGALQSLGSAYNWADDPDHKAKDVAKVWRDIIDEGDSCLEFRQDGCHLYLVANGIETLIYNGQECIDANILDGVLNRSNSGALGPPSPQQCNTYSVALNVGDTWRYPNAISTGDTILMSNWQGGATDLGLANVFWICPSGTVYQFGSCSDTLRSATSYGTDPLQTAPHLAVIAQIGSDYYDIWNSSSGITPATFTVPAGYANAPLKILMNIGDIVTHVAAGQMWGEITVCATHLWCYAWDFTISDYGWQPVAFFNAACSYVPGVGFRYSGSGSAPGVNLFAVIRKVGLTASDFVQGHICYTVVQGAHITSQIATVGFDDANGSGGLYVMPNRTPIGAYCDYSPVFAKHKDNVYFRAQASGNGSDTLSGSVTITQVRLYGTGANPFGVSNCT